MRAVCFERQCYALVFASSLPASCSDPRTLSTPAIPPGLLCALALVHLVAAENVTLCWGECKAPMQACTRAASSACLHARTALAPPTAALAAAAGRGVEGQLGNGSPASPNEQYGSGTPVVVSGGHSFLAACSGLSHSCSLEPSGQAWCFGAWGWVDGWVVRKTVWSRLMWQPI